MKSSIKNNFIRAIQTHSHARRAHNTNEEANEEMLDIMRRRAAVGTDVEVCILLDSALVRAQESTISGS